MSESPRHPSVERPAVCPVCGSPKPTTASKTIDASTYWHCGTCGEIWNVGRRQASGGDGFARKKLW